MASIIDIRVDYQLYCIGQEKVPTRAEKKVTKLAETRLPNFEKLILMFSFVFAPNLLNLLKSIPFGVISKDKLLTYRISISLPS